MKSSVFITGATGHIGKAVVAAVDPSRFERVTLFVRDKKKLYKEVQEKFHIVEGDSQNIEQLKAAAKGHNVALHCFFDMKAMANEPNVIKAIGESVAEASKGNHGVFITTTGLYCGGVSRTPDEVMEEDSPKNKKCEWDVEFLEPITLSFQSKEVSAAVLRPGWVYGNGSHVDQWVELCRQKGEILNVKNEHARLNPVHADDIAQLYWAIANGRHSGVFNAVEKSYKISDVVNHLSKELKLKIAPPMSFEEASKFHILFFFVMRDDFTLNCHGKRSAEIGWKPKHSLFHELAGLHA